MTYEVGQVLYLLNDRQMKIHVVQVAEQIVKRTKADEVITYMVVPAEELSASYQLDTSAFRGVFTDIEELRMCMEASAKEAIDEMLTGALCQVSSAFDLDDPGVKQEAEGVH